MLVASLILLQEVQQLKMTGRAWQAFMVTAIFLAFVITITVVILRYFRAQQAVDSKTKLREEFEKGKESLLAAAMAKKQASESASGEQRELSADEKERELLKENVDPERVIGQPCAICGLELSADEELIIDPYTGAGYHLSSFLNDWPIGDDGQPLPRPKFVYRYPEGTVVSSTALVRGF